MILMDRWSPISFSGRVFRMTFLMLAVSLAIPLLGAMMLLESPIDPQSFRAESGSYWCLLILNLGWL